MGSNTITEDRWHSAEPTTLKTQESFASNTIRLKRFANWVNRRWLYIYQGLGLKQGNDLAQKNPNPESIRTK